MVKKSLKTACLILMAAVLAINLLTMALSGLGLRERLNWLPGALLTVNSGSMEPTLSEGDLLFVWETPYEQLEVGDIVTFHGNNELITHQIVRREGSRFVTQGTANNTEDKPIGPEEYCAKVALVIPWAGRILELLTEPRTLVLLVMLVLALIYGPPVILHLAAVLSGEKKRFTMRLHRLLGACMAISMMCTTPFVTAAKYVANINEYASVVAGETYMTSNYLSEKGNTYEIEGWNGQGYGTTLLIRNYENALLFNKEGTNLSYTLKFEKIADGTTYSTDYYLIVRDSSGAELWNSSTDSGDGPSQTFTITGANEAGKTDTYQLSLNVTANDGKLEPGKLEPGEKVRFRITAQTTSDTDFARTLVGEFTLTATAAGSFLGEHGPSTNEGSSLVTYSIQTELVEGATTRKIKLSWNSNKMYINEYEATVAGIIAQNNSELYSDGKDTGTGFIVLSLGAYSKVDLQFFKINSSYTLVEGDFTCVEEEQTANEPTT